MFKKLQATDNCSCAVTGATAVVGGAMTGAMVLVVLVVVGGGDEIGVEVVFGTVDTVDGSLLDGGVLEPPHFPAPQ